MNENELLQYALVGNLAAGGYIRRRTLDLIEQHGFKPDYVTVPELRTLYDLLVKAESDDPTLLKAEALKTSRDAFVKCGDNVSVDPADVDRVVLGVSDVAKYREMDAIYESVKRTPATPEWKAAELARQFADHFRDITSKAATEGYSLAELQDPIAEEKDEDCLFKGRFLTKGAALVLASVSGSGKSVITLQFAYAWALGRPAFGIVPMRPLKIGIFQTEDDAQEMAGFRNSMREGYKSFHDWTADDLARAEANIRLFPMDGQTGDTFVEYLRRVQLKEKCDLVIVNPLQGVTDFDIASNTDMRAFVRQKLDGVIKRDDATKCGLMIVHHTNKPPAANMRAGFGTDQYAQYVGAGASELTNWMRAMLSIMPSDEAGRYKLVAAKRGERLGWPRLMVNNKPTAKPTKLIRHSTPDEKVMFWHEVSDGNTQPAEPEKPSVTKDAARLAGLLKENALPLTEARNLAKKRLGRKRGEAAYEELIAKLSDYEVVIAATGISTQKVIGSEESVKNAISTLRGKHLQDVAVKFGKTEGE